MAVYRKLYDDVESLGKLNNFDGYVFKDKQNRLHLIHSDSIEEYASVGELGYIYYKILSNEASHVFRKTEIE